MRPLILIALTCALQAVAGDERATARDRMAAMFSEEFKFDAELNRKSEEPLAIDADEDVVVLPSVSVREPFRGVDKAVDEAVVRGELEHFTWKHGGTIRTFERLPLQPKIQFKYNPDHKGIDLLNFSW